MLRHRGKGPARIEVLEEDGCDLRDLSMTLNVQMPAGGTFEVEARSQDKVVHLKRRLHADPMYEAPKPRLQQARRIWWMEDDWTNRTLALPSFEEFDYGCKYLHVCLAATSPGCQRPSEE